MYVYKPSSARNFVLLFLMVNLFPASGFLIYEFGPLSDLVLVHTDLVFMSELFNHVL